MVLLDDEDVAKVMETKLGTKHFNVTSWTLEAVKGAAGFLGQYFNLKVTCQPTNERTPRRFVFFVKTNPRSDVSTYEFSIRNDILNREITTYEQLMPHMGAGNGSEWKPDFFLGKKNVAIVLEDAVDSGYKVADKNKRFDQQEFKVLLRALAKFHAGSMILDVKQGSQGKPTVLELYGPVLNQIFYVNGDPFWDRVVRDSTVTNGLLVDLVREFDEVTKLKVKSRSARWFGKIADLMGPSTKYRNAVCHFDLWANNVMIKRNEDSGLMENCYMIDFQYLSWLPPAVDFLGCLYLNTGRRVRNEHFADFTRFYYEILGEEFRKEGLDLGGCLSWQEFRESCECYKPLAVIVAAFKLPLILLELRTEDFVKMKGADMHPIVGSLFERSERYREGITDIYRDVNELVPDEPGL